MSAANGDWARPINLRPAVPEPFKKLQYYAHTLVEGNVEWGKEAKGTGQADYHDYFEVNVSPQLPVIRSRQEDYGTTGNFGTLRRAKPFPWVPNGTPLESATRPRSRNTSLGSSPRPSSRQSSHAR